MNVRTFLQIQPNVEQNKIFKVENNRTLLLLKQEEYMKFNKMEPTPEKEKSRKTKDLQNSDSDFRREVPLEFNERNSYAFDFKRVFNASQCTKDIFNYYEKTNSKGRKNLKYKIKNFFLLGDKNIKKNGFSFGKQFNSIKIKGMVEEYIDFYKAEEGLNSQLNLSSNRSLRRMKKSMDSVKLLHKGRSSSKYKLFAGSESLKTNSYLEKKSILKMKKTMTLHNFNSSEMSETFTNDSSFSDMKKYTDLFEVMCVRYVKERRFILNKKFKFVPIDRFFNRKAPGDSNEGKTGRNLIVSVTSPRCPSSSCTLSRMRRSCCTRCSSAARKTNATRGTSSR